VLRYRAACDPLPTSHSHSALASAASVMDSQYISTLHSRAPTLPPHLTGERHLPWNSNNSAVAASAQYLQPATCTDIPLQPIQSYPPYPELTFQASAHALTPHLTNVNHLPGILSQSSYNATVAHSQPNFQSGAYAQPIDSRSIDLSLPTVAQTIRSASLQSAYTTQALSTATVATDLPCRACKHQCHRL